MYAYVRCLNDSTASVEQKVRWVRWEPDASPESQCYVKCVSEELRLFDVRERRFRPERLILQAETYAHSNPAELDRLRTNAEPMLSGTLDDPTCEAVFNKYATFYSTHTFTILKMFHGDHRNLMNTYRMLGDNVKQIGETFVQFCEKRHGAGKTWSEDDDCPAPALVDCVLRGFRWITEEGEVNVNEIRRDFAAAELASDSDCASASGASALFQCLREASGADSLNKVIRERNERTAFYFDATSQEEPWKSAVEFGQQLMIL